ncbi:MAG: hypothetical protein SNJ57_18700 [Cyanobacteriota bacterium]
MSTYLFDGQNIDRWRLEAAPTQAKPAYAGLGSGSRVGEGRLC